MLRLSLIASLLMLSACTTVQPWEKDLLAKPSMALVPDKLELYLDDHIYFSKEASTGGQGVGGGGCGCN
ncbi:MAG TPA: DUF4266 domain-containing protein [Gammaproteobacteria bacterium]|nr:DUF4266 domain-containing protein [Gammaproteobacteria bacterium]